MQGYYWRPKTWEIVLKKPVGEKSYRIPTTAMLMLAPVMGALFVVFLPTIGLLMIGQYCTKVTLRAVCNRVSTLHRHARSHA